MWKPIETAPRDGTPVDLWHKNGFRITDVWWTDDNCWTSLALDKSYTHWMDIPNPPNCTKSLITSHLKFNKEK